VTNVLEDSLAQKGGQLGSASTAANPGEAVVEDAAVEVAADGLVQESPPEAVAPLEALLPLVAHVVVDRLDETVQRRRVRLPRAVEGTG
jgi:hypothetical protein